MQRFPTYKNLVENENDLIGLIAYSLYKQDKFAFVEQASKAAGAEPSDAQMETFCSSSNLPNRLLSYREAAASVLERINGEILESAINQVKQEYQEDLEEHLTNLGHPSMSREIGVHAAAGFIVWAVVVFLLIAAYFVKNGIPAAVQNLTGYQLAQPPAK